MSENVTIHDKKESVQSILLVKNDSFPKTDDILRFQQPNNQHFSSKNNKKHTKKQSKRPKYRVINKYVKSKKKVLEGTQP